MGEIDRVVGEKKEREWDTHPHTQREKERDGKGKKDRASDNR